MRRLMRLLLVSRARREQQQRHKVPGQRSSASSRHFDGGRGLPSVPHVRDAARGRPQVPEVQELRPARLRQRRQPLYQEEEQDLKLELEKPCKDLLYST